jgi:hypothetical protein
MKIYVGGEYSEFTKIAERHIRSMRRKNKLDPILANFRSKAKEIRYPNFNFLEGRDDEHLNLLYLKVLSSEMDPAEIRLIR